ATTVIINSGKARYSWTTILPLSFVATTTLVAGWESITDIFWPLAQRADTAAQGYVNTALTAILMAASVIILVDSVRRWTRGSRGQETGAKIRLADAGETA
ncbi:MAG: hypothetical protein DMF66_17665, partial [Acidobacteria bacterium]